jgi:hypothetical protein
MVHTRAKADRGCPFCAGRRLSVTNSLKTRFPKVAREWHPENSSLSPAKVQYGSHRKVWWRCRNGHEWQATPNTRTSGNGCPACSGHLATSTTSLAGVAPLVAAQWDHRRNRGVTPDAVTAGAMTKYWWRCPVARDHVWQATVASRVRGKSGCPACWGNLVTKSNCLATTRPDIAASWHPTRNRALTPRDVTPGSGRQVWWKCPVARDHVWRTSVGNRTVGEGRGCPFCANRLASATNSLGSRYAKIAREFDEKRNGVSPRNVVATSRKKYWWRCSKVKSHRWEAAPVRRTQDGSGCPHCAVRVRPHSKSLVFREWL